MANSYNFNYFFLDNDSKNQLPLGLNFEKSVKVNYINHVKV